MGRFIAEAVYSLQIWPQRSCPYSPPLPLPSPSLPSPSLASPHKPQGINLFTGHNLSIAAFSRLHSYLLWKYLQKVSNFPVRIANLFFSVYKVHLMHIILYFSAFMCSLNSVIIELCGLQSSLEFFKQTLFTKKMELKVETPQCKYTVKKRFAVFPSLAGKIDNLFYSERTVDTAT